MTLAASRAPVQPILVVLVYRGGARFLRALESIGRSEHLFRRIVVSVTGDNEGDDMQAAQAYLREHAEAGTPSKVELICSGVELRTMDHQRFWISYLERTGGHPQDWIYWLAYDDQVRPLGIERIVDEHGNWPLEQGTAYFGPWAMRHEQADQLFAGPWDEPLESWTSFPLPGPTRLPVAAWIAQQLRQPTYMQMTGSVTSFLSHQRLASTRLRKRGPMRIEMETAADTGNVAVAEFAEPVSIIYGRPNSDRASYGRSARWEDLHLAAWLARYSSRHPRSIPVITRGMASVASGYRRVMTGSGSLPEELWVVRETVEP